MNPDRTEHRPSPASPGVRAGAAAFLLLGCVAFAAMALMQTREAHRSFAESARLRAQAQDLGLAALEMRLEAALKKNSAEMLRSLGPVRRFQPESLSIFIHQAPSGELPQDSGRARQELAALLEKAATRTALEALAQPAPPLASASAETAEPDPLELARAISAAGERINLSETNLRPAMELYEDLNSVLSRLATAPAQPPISGAVPMPPVTPEEMLYRDYNAARWHWLSQVLKGQSQLKQHLAFLLEFRGRQCGGEALRHFYSAALSLAGSLVCALLLAAFIRPKTGA